MMLMPKIKIGDIQLHYVTHGQGEPLLLIHGGWGLGVNGFHYQEKTLVDAYRLIVPDRRGYGRSTPVYGFTADFHWQHAADMVQLLDELQIDRVWVWGHSDGATIGVIMAITAPERVRGLVFEDGHLYSLKDGWQLKTQELYDDPRQLPDAACTALAAYHGADYWPQVIRNWAGGWLQLYRRVGDLYRHRLDEVRCPILIMHGAHDEYAPVSEIEELARRIPRSRLVIFPEGGHSLHDQRSTREECTQLVREWLRTANV